MLHSIHYIMLNQAAGFPEAISTQGWPGTEPGGATNCTVAGGRGGEVDVRGGKQCCCRCLIECYCGGGRNWPKNDKTNFFLKNIKKK